MSKLVIETVETSKFRLIPSYKRIVKKEVFYLEIQDKANEKRKAFLDGDKAYALYRTIKALKVRGDALLFNKACDKLLNGKKIRIKKTEKEKTKKVKKPKVAKEVKRVEGGAIFSIRFPGTLTPEVYDRLVRQVKSNWPSSKSVVLECGGVIERI